MKTSLFDETTFYQSFISDLKNCKHEIIIESPFITEARTISLIPLFKWLLYKKIKIFVFTRDPKEHYRTMEYQSEEMISLFERLGIQVFLCTGNHHRKLAIIDRQIIYEGSLNILSQANSREIMRRIEDKNTALELFNFLRFGRFI